MDQKPIFNILIRQSISISAIHKVTHKDFVGYFKDFPFTVKGRLNSNVLKSESKIFEFQPPQN